ncbi:amidohydrolase [Paraeggerthella sp.]|uniref:amidohydrolase n=1 Tax=Paraeggerthella sp. TaxID=2897350 RepID=UPI003AB888E1
MKTLYCNGDFVPMTDANATFEALLVEDDGTIAFAGALDEARNRAGDAREIDLEGKTVLPGFIDPHSHLTGTTQYISTASLSECTSFDDIVNALTAFIEKRGITADGVVMGTGYDQNFLVEGQHPTKDVLDRASREIPIFIVHASGHMGVANSRSLELVGVTAETPDPEGGLYGRVEGSMEPNGYAEEPATLFNFYAMCQPRMNLDVPAMFDEMQDYYLENGVTTAQDGATQPDFADMLAAFARAGKMKLDIVGYPMDGHGVEGMLERNADFDSQDYIGHFRLGGIKMFLDGSPQGRTAWMTQPYEPGEDGATDYVAYGTMSDDEAYAFIRSGIDTNHQVLCHCNGDAAGDQLIAQYKRALEDSPNPNKHKLRPVMIHCQTIRQDQYQAMAEIGMIPSIFTSHIWYWGDIHLNNFGQARGGRISAVRDALDAGLPFTFHTDVPVVPPKMLETVWCAVNRITKAGVQLDESQKIDVFDGLKAITINGAYQYGEEERKGTLEVGKLADLVILDANPLKVDPMDIRSIKVLETIKEGTSVYRCA